MAMTYLFLGVVIGSLITVFAFKICSKPAAKVKREGMMTLDQYVRLHRLSEIPPRIHEWALKYDNYDPEVIEQRLFPKEKG